MEWKMDKEYVIYEIFKQGWKFILWSSGYDTVQSCKRLCSFQRTLLPPIFMSALKMEAAGTSTLLVASKTTHCHNPENNNLNRKYNLLLMNYQYAPVSCIYCMLKLLHIYNTAHFAFTGTCESSSFLSFYSPCVFLSYSIPS